VARHACVATSTTTSFTYLKRSLYPALRSFVMSRHGVRLLSEGRMLVESSESLPVACSTILSVGSVGSEESIA
jgi:hypothetical protein